MLWIVHDAELLFSLTFWGLASWMWNVLSPGGGLTSVCTLTSNSRWPAGIVAVPEVGSKSPATVESPTAV